MNRILDGALIHWASAVAIFALALLPIDILATGRSIMLGEYASPVLLGIGGLMVAATILRGSRPTMLRAVHFFWAIVLFAAGSRSLLDDQIFPVSAPRELAVAAGVLLLIWAGFEMLAWVAAGRLSPKVRPS